MISKTAVLALLPLALGAVLPQGHTLQSRRASVAAQFREPTQQCFGNQEPNYDDCQSVTENNINCADASGIIDGPTPGYNQAFWAEGNCRMILTWWDTNYRISNQQVCLGYGAVRELCGTLGSGGSYSQNPSAYEVRWVNNPEYIPPVKAKRQQEGDSEYNVAVQLNGVLQEDLRQEIARGSSGTTIDITEEQTVENSLTLSASVSAGLAGIVEVSTGIDISQTYSSSSSFGVSIPINCGAGQTGVIFFIPAFNIWRGSFQPSGDYLEVKQPAVNPDGRTTGEFRVECQG